MRRLACIALSLAIAGCGFGAGGPRGESGAELRVTRDFGRTTLTHASTETIRESDTVMRFLQAHAKTTTRYGGKFVQSIAGISGNSKGGRHDWFYFVNGVLGDRSATEVRLRDGDVEWWDYRRWTNPSEVQRP